VTVTNGVGNTTVSGLAVGDYVAVAIFEETEVFNASSDDCPFSVLEKPDPADSNLTISVDDIREGTDAVICITADKAFSGNVTVQILSDNYNVSVVNGLGSYSVSGLAVGNYTAVATFEDRSIYCKH
jgi:hypothetical protein